MDDDDVALFDMDGSLAGYNEALVRDLEALRSPGEAEVTDENLWTLDKHDYIRNRMRLIKSQAGWWLNLPPIQAGLDVLNVCREAGFTIAILTKGPQKHSNAWAEKLLWCQQHVGHDVDVTVTFKKARVYGKILYDDFPDYMEAWLKRRPRGLGIMPVTPGNRNFSHPQVVMYRGVEDLDRVAKAIKIAKDRRPGEPLVLENP